MTTQTEKRYIVLYKDVDTSEEEAASILGAMATEVQDGVYVLSTEKPLEESDVLHFGEIGATTLTLSDEDAAKLREDSRVAEVVKDIEVFALGELLPDVEYGLSQDQPIDADEQLMSAYQAGYQQAYEQIAPQTKGNGAYGSQGPSSLRFPFPFPPRFPIWPFPWPRRQPVGWNIQLVRAEKVWHRVTGRGVKVAIIDTGIDNNHADLTVRGGASFVPGVASWDDDHGHGTHCAGIVAARNNFTGVVGVAPHSELYAVKVLRPLPNGRASGQLSWILAGMAWALRANMDVVSMSLGSMADNANASCILAYQRAAQRLIDNDCVVVSSAGNSFGTSKPWVGQPARCSNFMAVAAVDKNKRIASFSSRGPASLGDLRGVEISAPGVRVRSTLPGGSYGNMSGTSMACPHVAGAAALLKELHPTWAPDKIRNRLKQTAQDLGAVGKDQVYGAGLLDCYQAVFS